MTLKRDQAFQPLLVPLHGGGDKKPRPLDRDVITVGRARGCDLVLDAPDISTLHCIIYRAPDGYRLRDCGSRTGIRVNGQPLKLGLITDSDVLQVGPFSFEVKIPGIKGSDLKKYDFRLVEKLVKSRRKLGQLALRWRRKVHALKAGGGGVNADLNRQAADLKAKVKAFDGRLSQLEEAERDLETDRACLKQDQESHQAHVQKVEADLAAMLNDAQAQIHQSWQEFQKRCRHQEERHAEHLEQQRRLLAQEQDLWRQTRAQEESTMQNRIGTNGDPQHSLDEQRQSLAQAETVLREQRTELARMVSDLKSLQESIRRQQNANVQDLLDDNQRLREHVAQLEQRQANSPPAASTTLDPNLEKLDEENLRLRELLAEKIQEVKDLGQQVKGLQQRPAHSGAAAAPAGDDHEDRDLESFEAELNRFRLQLEADRNRLNKELEQFRERQAELDEATREMEMAMSKERAELGRERMRLDRLRDDVKNELERLQRDGDVLQSLAPVQRLREQLHQRSRQ